MDDFKENDVESIEDYIPRSPSPIKSPKRPLSSRSSMNSLTSPSKSLSGKQEERIEGESSVKYHHLQQRYLALSNNYSKKEKQYLDVMAKYNTMMAELAEIEQKFHYKAQEARQNLEMLQTQEEASKKFEMESQRQKDLYEQDRQYYKNLIKDLQAKVTSLSNEFQTKAQNDNDGTWNDSLLEKYEALAKKYRILQSNYELENNSKSILIQQIEALTKDNEMKATEQGGNFFSHPDNASDGDYNVYADEYLPSSQELDDIFPNSDYARYNISDGNNPSLNFLSDELNDNIGSSSPLKDITNPGVDMNQDSNLLHDNYGDDDDSSREAEKIEHRNSAGAALTLPPQHDVNHWKRLSLPTKLRHVNCNEQFILSPLKLAEHNAYTSSDELVLKSNKRKSNSRPYQHSYSSYDIVPIKVEFEPPKETTELSDPSKRDRSNSKFSKDVNMIPRGSQGSKSDTAEDLSEHNIYDKSNFNDRDFTYSKLNGFGNGGSNRSSSITAHSSKRGSAVGDSFIESNLTMNDMTRQELTKLKFELRSLKLHNEKLLSFIGFELQKQKKNIKKLSNKRSQSSLRGSRKIEYSDAKLIEKSKDVLIRKKRVLRSVSVNPIFSKKAEPNFVGIITDGLLPVQDSSIDHLYPFNSDYINSIDQNEDESDLTLSPRHYDQYKTSNFVDCDRGNKTANLLPGTKSVKKFQSQVFHNNHYDAFESSFEWDEDDDEWQDISNEDGCYNSNAFTGGVFGHMRKLLNASFYTSRKADNESFKKDPQSEGLKYKFLSVAIGILIIGLRCASQDTIEN